MTFSCSIGQNLLLRFLAASWKCFAAVQNSMQYKYWQTAGRRLFFIVFDAILALPEREGTIIVLWMRRQD